MKFADISFGLQYPFFYTRNLRWWYVVDKRTGQACFFVPLFIGWRAERITADHCQSLNTQWCGYNEPIPLDEIDTTS